MKTQITLYSLAPNRVGEPLPGGETKEHATPKDAMRYLSDVIGGKLPFPFPKQEEAGESYFLVTKQNESMPLNACYRLYYGEDPYMNRRGEFCYPKLGRGY